MKFRNLLVGRSPPIFNSACLLAILFLSRLLWKYARFALYRRRRVVHPASLRFAGRRSSLDVDYSDRCWCC